MDHHVGHLDLTYSQTIEVNICEWKGELGVDVRKHIKTPAYSGPTPQGVRMSIRQFRQILDGLRENVSMAAQRKVGILGWTGKNFDLDIVVQIAEFNGQYRLDIREQFVKNGAKLYSRKGVAVPIEKYADFVSLLEEALWFIDNLLSDLKNN